MVTSKPGAGGAGTESGLAQLRVDGSQPITADLVARVSRACEDGEAAGGLVVHVTGTPGPGFTDGLDVALVSRWERALRRMERLRAVTVAVAEGDCGGTALDAMLATDYRVATAGTRLMVPVRQAATWPGMALYRLAHQGSTMAAVRRAVLFGEPIDAAHAQAAQLLDEVADDPAAALAHADRVLHAHPGTEVAIRRQLMLEARTTSFEEALGAHLAACDRALRRAAAGAAS